MGRSPPSISCSLSTSSISRNDMSGLMSFAAYWTIRPASRGPAWRQTFRVRFTIRSRDSLVTPLGKMHVLEVQRLLVQPRLLTSTSVLPGRDVGEMLVIPERLAVFSLVLLSEVAAAGFFPMKCIPAHQLAELQKIGHPAGFLEGLIQLGIAAGNIDVAPVLGANLRDPLQRVLESGRIPRHATVVPHQLAQLAVEGVDRSFAPDPQQPSGEGRHLSFNPPAFGVARIDFVQLGRRQIVTNRRWEYEVAVGQALHQRAGAQAIGAVIGKVCLPDDMEPWDGAHQVVIDPEPAHGIVDRRENPHRHPIGIVIGDPLVHLEQIAVAVADGLLPEPADDVGKMQIDAESTLPHPAAFVADFLGGAGRDVTRSEVAEAGVLPLQEIVPLTLWNLTRSSFLPTPLRHPDPAVVPERLAYSRQLRLVFADHRYKGGVNLGIARIGKC